MKKDKSQHKTVSDVSSPSTLAVGVLLVTVGLAVYGFCYFFGLCCH